MKIGLKSGLLAVFVIGLVVFGGAALAYKAQGRMNRNNENEIDFTDYESFVDSIEELDNKPIYAGFIDEDEFDLFVENHNQRFLQREQMQLARDNKRAAIESGDYEAYLAAVNGIEGSNGFTVLSEADFETLVKMHEARESGDYELASELRDELGFENSFGPMGKGKMHSNGGCRYH